MVFDELVEHIMRLTGLSTIQAARLLTGQIYLLTDSLITATTDPMIDAMVAERIMVMTAVGVAEMKPLIK